MSNKKIWFITGAGRGMGVDFAKAALAAGHAVEASGRDTDRVSRALGPSNDPVARAARRNCLRVTITLRTRSSLS
jgi:NAD(P)-dependent dehydrogenase (short-subunit alcohol dehydrogenase family)